MADIKQLIYEREVKCNVCDNNIQVTDVRVGKARIDHFDEDHCPYYTDVNPILYDVWVCPYCGYAALQKNFDKISVKKAKMVKQKISVKWTPRDFRGERDNEKAVECYKLALLNAYTTEAKDSEIANICVRLAWVYRYLEDKASEEQFIKHAILHYDKAYLNETFPMDRLDEANFIYLMGELNRRVGENEKASSWFAKIVSLPTHMRKQELVNKAKEQWQLIKDSQK